MTPKYSESSTLSKYTELTYISIETLLSYISILDYQQKAVKLKDMLGIMWLN